MIGYIYSTESNEIICEIHGVDNADIEAKASELNYLGEDAYGMTYTRGLMAYATGHDYLTTSEHEAKYA